MSSRTKVRLDRQVPSWAAMLLARLAQDRPTVVTRDDLADYLAEAGSSAISTTRSAALSHSAG